MISSGLRPAIDHARLEIRLLTHTDADNLRGFRCADADLDDFLQTDALRLQDQHDPKTYICLYDNELVGYVATCTAQVELKTGERKKLSLRSYDHPNVSAVLIARLAVSADFRALHRGAGEALVHHAYGLALHISELVGCRLLVVDAYPESVAFYEHLGFKRNTANTYKERTNTSLRLDLFAPIPPAWLSRQIRGAPSGPVEDT